MLLKYIEKSKYLHILYLLTYYDRSLWFIRMLEIGADCDESNIIDTVIENNQLPVIVELIYRGLDYKQYISQMDSKIANYLLEHFN